MGKTSAQRHNDFLYEVMERAKNEGRGLHGVYDEKKHTLAMKIMREKEERTKKYPGSVSYRSHAHDKHELPSNEVLRKKYRRNASDYY